MREVRSVHPALLVPSICVAFAFALMLLVLVPTSRRRPKVREGLWLAWLMLGLSLFSIVAFIVIASIRGSVAIYALVMLIAFCTAMWLRLRYRARQAPDRA